MKPTSIAALVLLCSALAVPAWAQAPDGEAIYERTCAMCHTNPGPDSRAMNREALGRFAPETILTALTTGNMFRQGSGLTDAERRAVAAFVAGRPVGTPAPPSTVGQCTSTPAPLTAADLASGWNGWGVDARNLRYVSAERGGLTPPQVPRLRLKWAFGFPGVSSARAQPAVLGQRVFVASEGGDVFALDAGTGCTYWRFHAQAGIRTAVSLGPYSAGGRSGFAVYFSDGSATAYAVDAQTGAGIWSRRVDDHPYAKSTGSVTVHGGRVYVPTAGVGEEGTGGSATYACCTFRGSVTALDASTGAVVWKSYSIPVEPASRGANAQGVQLWGPAGGGIWAAPTVDESRRAIYVATGNGYAGPPQPTTDAVLALDMDTGAIRWSFQPTENDIWTGGCRAENPDNPNCPQTLGPDHDFSMSPILATRSNGEDIVIVLQKSGMAYAVDPDDGALVWEYRTSGGSSMGGQWGGAADATQVYFGVNGSFTVPGGMRAASIDTGAEVWSKPAEPTLCEGQRGCSAAQGAAVTAVPGVVFSGSMDGGLRAYAADDGTLLWSYDTNREFDTVNGVPANGGAIDGPGPVVAGGMVFINSGYISLIGRPGNVLLAFGVEE
jgi:polyvinyl alcohol dehydrogenase (cytochrome)